jgi:hypothetical protein
MLVAMAPREPTAQGERCVEVRLGARYAYAVACAGVGVVCLVLLPRLLALGVAAAAAWTLAGLGLALKRWERIRVRVDRPARVVVVERRSWLGPERRAAYPLPEVLDVAIDEAGPGRGRLAFVLPGGRRAVLSEGAHSIARQRPTASALRELLSSVDDER